MSENMPQFTDFDEKAAAVLRALYLQWAQLPWPNRNVSRNIVHLGLALGVMVNVETAVERVGLTSQEGERIIHEFETRGLIARITPNVSSHYYLTNPALKMQDSIFEQKQQKWQAKLLLGRNTTVPEQNENATWKEGITMKLKLSRDEVAGIVGPELKRRRIPYRRDIDGDAISYVIINDDKVDVGAFITSPGKTKVEIFPDCPDEDIESLGNVLQVLEAAVWQEQERREWVQKAAAEIDAEVTDTGKPGEQKRTGTNRTGRIHNLGEGSPDIIGISSDLYRKLRTVLSNCGPFATDQELSAIFIDERLRPWRNRLPQADNRIGRVERVIDFLHNQYNDVGENVLVLLLRVLSERPDPGDACHHRLVKLADELDHEITSLINDIFERPERPIPKPS